MTDRFRDTLKRIYTASSDREQPPSPPPPPLSRSDLRSLLIRIESLESQLSDLSQRLDSLEQTISSLRDVADQIGSVLELRSTLEQLVSVLQQVDFSAVEDVSSRIERVPDRVSDLLIQFRQDLQRFRRELDSVVRVVTLVLPLDQLFEKVGTLSPDELKSIEFTGPFAVLFDGKEHRFVDRFGNVYRYDPSVAPDWLIHALGIYPVSPTGVANPELPFSNWNRVSRRWKRRMKNGGGGSSA